MSNQQQGLSTPHRNMYNLFDSQRKNKEEVKDASYTYTPCTRLSRMTIDSQSNGINGRIRTAHFQSPATNFKDKMMQALCEEEESHPNLTMFLGSDGISMSKDNQNNFSFSEDEDSSDEGDLLSSSSCPMSSPDRNEPPVRKMNIFDDDDDEDENIADLTDFYDTTNSWLSCIYEDPSPTINSSQSGHQKIDDDEYDDNKEEATDDENRPPRFWHSNKQQLFEKKTRRTVPHEEDNTVQERIPLREIHLEDYLSDNEDVPAKKKMILSNGKPHKMRFMRTLSPPRFASKRKGNL